MKRPRFASLTGGLRIFATARPTTRGGPVLPMSREDAEFWRLRRERDLERAARAPR